MMHATAQQFLPKFSLGQIVATPGALDALHRFARSKPYRGTIEECKPKFLALHHDLCNIYIKQTTLSFDLLDGGDSGSSCYRPESDEILLNGRLSVVTYLHEFAHALGKD